MQESLDICSLVVSKLTVNIERILAACTFELFAADRAYELAVAADMPFRDAYRIVGAEVMAQLDRHIPLPVESQEQLVARLKARSHLGGAGNPGFEQAQQRLQGTQAAWQERAAVFKHAIGQLVGPCNVALIEE